MNINDLGASINGRMNVSPLNGENSFDGQIREDQVGKEILKSMNSRDTLEGTIVDIKGNEASVRLSQGEIVNALLSDNSNISVGQSFIFEVNKSTDGNILLRTLFTNNAGQAMAGEALSNAGIPVDSTSLNMIKDMMDSGMNIDRNSLNEMYRCITSNPEIPQDELVLMKSFGLEPTPENIKQFDALMNYTDTVSNSLETIIDSFPEEVNNLISNGQFEGALKFSSDIFALLSDKEIIPDNPNDNLSSETKVFTEESINSGKVSNDNDRDLINLLKNAMGDNLISENDKLGDILKSLNIDYSADSASNELFNNLSDLSEQGKISSSDIQKLFTNDEFKNILKMAMNDKFLLEPEKLEEKGSVSDYYNKLTDKVRNFTESFGKIVPEEGNLAKAMDNLNSKVDFLNMLNNYMPYVQLPLKMNSDARTGDLYVYSGRKNLTGDNDEITALLHLDMEYLGKMDVFVKLKDLTNVSTNFTLENDEILDFLADHMDLLTERLKDRGYTVETSMKTSQKYENLAMRIEEGFPADFDNEESSEEVKNIIYRFDMRA